MAMTCCTPLLCPRPALLSIYWLWAAIWNEFSWHTSYTSSGCRQHRYVIFVLLLPGQSGILMALTIYSHTGKPRSPNSSLIWITGPCYSILLSLQIQPKTSPLHVTWSFLRLSRTTLTLLLLCDDLATRVTICFDYFWIAQDLPVVLVYHLAIVTHFCPKSPKVNSIVHPYS